MKIIIYGGIDEQLWLKTFKKIKNVAKQTKGTIVAIDLCEYTGNLYKDKKDLSTVITIADQMRLFI